MRKNTDQVRQRPLSPHLTIYKPQITSVMSILHRMTGAFLYIGTVAIVWILFCSVYYYDSSQKHDSIICKILIFSWFCALSYHLLNGIRHLFWDIGCGFSISSVNKTGITVLILTLCSAVYMYYLIF